ncbi:MAG: hypothetical protein FWD29_05375 [Micrococcales bacterium]|nr:hypothetical protein [Micrococcales bacterium]
MPGWGVQTASTAQAAPATQATSQEKLYLEVNSTAFLGSDAAPGNGICSTATAGQCTLRAAIEEANALAANGDPRDVVITVATTFREGGTTASVTSTTTASGWMASTSVTGRPLWDIGAYFTITAPGLTIDLDNRYELTPDRYNPVAGVAFSVNAPNVTLRNLTRVFGVGATIYASPSASGLVVDKGDARQSYSDAARRYILIHPGADNVTVRDLTVGRLNPAVEEDGTSAASGYGAIVLDSKGLSQPIVGLTVERVRFDQTSAGGACGYMSGTACNSSGLVAYNGVNIEGLTIRDSYFTGHAGGHAAISLNHVGDLKNISLVGNRFHNNPVSSTTEMFWQAVVRMAQAKLANGRIEVRHNTFDATAKPIQADAFLFSGALDLTHDAAEGAKPSNVYVEDNDFDGFQWASVDMYARSRASTIKRNTFGTATRTDLTTKFEESSHQSYLMVSNSFEATNGKIVPWIIDSVTHQPGGLAQVKVVQNTTNLGTYGRAVSAPVEVDIYWTASRTAEVYLGSIRVGSGTEGTGVIPLPSTTGYLRTQTFNLATPQVQSSQFSRTFALSGMADTMPPTVTLAPAVTQDLETSRRFIRYYLETNEVLATTPGAEAFSLTGSTAYNPRVSQVERLSARRYLVTVAVDDSGLVNLTLLAGAVQDKAGNANPRAVPATKSVTFTNPLRLSASSLTVTEGEAVKDALSLFRDISAQATVGLRLESAPPDVSLAGGAVQLRTAWDQTGFNLAVADDGLPLGDRTGTVTFKAQSADPNLDGLRLVLGLEVKDSTVSSLSLTKQGWTNANPPVSADSLLANATPLPSGSTVRAGTSVWWTYTVTNTGNATLTDVVVVDSALGQICSFAELSPGKSERCHAGGGPIG